VLERLLSLLAMGGVHTLSELAARLEVSENLFNQMLSDLSRTGYLRPASRLACNTPCCTDCPLTGACAVDEPGGRVWALTDKALRWGEAGD
jgi:hypothetical protein